VNAVIATLRLFAGISLFAVCVSAQGADPLRITVIGGGGTIGQRIVTEALDRGHRVTIVARDPARVTAQRERLEVQKGDVLDTARMTELMKGQDVVVSAAGSARHANPDITLYRKAAESLVAALRHLGSDAPRLIVVGGAGSLKNASGEVLVERQAPEKRYPESVGQKAALDYYRTITDVSWTYFSPAALIQPGKRTAVFRLADEQIVRDENGESRISIEDYAVATVDEAETPRHEHRQFTIGY
jgi:putative NADH-flavin reductase